MLRLRLVLCLFVVAILSIPLSAQQPDKSAVLAQIATFQKLLTDIAALLNLPAPECPICTPPPLVVKESCNADGSPNGLDEDQDGAIDEICRAVPPACTFSLGASSANVPAATSSGNVLLTASRSDCAWTASSGATWLAVTASGTGSASVSYSASANTVTVGRSGTLTIASLPFTVNQAAAAPLPVDCAVSAWALQSAGAWGTCSAAGQQTRTETWARTITTQPSNGGAACPALTEIRTGTQSCTPPSGGAPIRVSTFDGVPKGCGVASFAEWPDWGGSGACSGTTHDADVVADPTADGGSSLRITQKPGNQNGTDFRFVWPMNNLSESTLVWKQKWDAATWRWAGADHKNVIWGTTQWLYQNHRGGSDPQHGRVCIALPGPDVVYCDNDQQTTVGRWYEFKTYVLSGTHGRIDAWFRDCGANNICPATWTKFNLTKDAGQGTVNLADVNLPTQNQVKGDTTYNLGSNITALWYHYFDSFRLYSGLF